MSRRSDDIIALRLQAQKNKLLKTKIKSISKSIINEARQSLRKMAEMNDDELNNKLSQMRIKLILRRKVIREAEDRLQVSSLGKSLKRIIAIIHLINEELKQRDNNPVNLSCDEDVEIEEEDEANVERNLSFEESVLLSLDNETLEDILLDRFTEELEDHDFEDRKLTPEEQHDMIHYQMFERDNGSEQSENDVCLKNCADCGREIILFEEEDEILCGKCFDGFFESTPDIDDIELGDYLMDAFPVHPLPIIPFEPTFPTFIQPEPIDDIPEEFVDKAEFFYPTCSWCDLDIYEDSTTPGFCVWCDYALMHDDIVEFPMYSA